MAKRRGDTPEEDWALGLVEEGPITKLEANPTGWTITVEWTCGLGRDRCPVGVEPKLGDIFATFGQIGYAFHGQALNGRVLWYKTRAEEEAEHQQWLSDHSAKQHADFEKAKPQLDADYDGLPPLFKMRIDRFRAANADFRWESEGYEMFVCTQAVLLADWARAQVDDREPGWKDEAVAKIDAWDRINSKENDPPYDYNAQLAVVPGWKDGHSGNTHSCAVFLAKQYLQASESVAVLPGALAPLVGTADYSKVGGEGEGGRSDGS